MEAIVAAALAPFLPYLVRAGQRAGEDIADALGSEAGRLARALWERLRPRFDARPTAREAAEDVAGQPDNELARAALQHQLTKILADDPSLRHEIEKLLEDGHRAGAFATEGGVAITGGQHAESGGIVVGRDLHGNIRTSR